MAAAGTVLSASETVYDDLGRTKWAVQFVGTPAAAKTEMVYDAVGRQKGTLTYLDAGFTTASSTWSEFDTGGRVIATIDPLGKRTETEYDGDSRAIKVTFADGAYTLTGYNAKGLKVEESVVVD